MKKQKESNYKMPQKGFNCPHCNTPNYTKKKQDETLDTYELPRDTEHNETSGEGIHWTEDKECSTCGEKYSTFVGC